MTPRYSILIPAYKKTHLDAAIASVLSQDYEDWELIIVDDNSPENLSDIVLPYLSDTRVSYSRNANGHGAQHIVENWNECLKLARGEFVMCMGDDDLLMPYCLSEYDALIDKHPGLDVYHTRLVVIDVDGNTRSEQEPRPELESAYSMLWNKWNGCRQSIGDWLFRTEALKENGGFVDFPYGWASDDITVAAVARRHGIANCNVFCYGYRMHDAAITSTHNTQLTLGKLEAWDAVSSWLDIWFETPPANAEDGELRDLLIQHKTSYISSRKRGDLYHGLTRSPQSLWFYMKCPCGVPRPVVFALWIKRLIVG